MIILQIGTNNGKDHVNRLCIETNPDRIILVEPFTIHNESIKENYNNLIDKVIIENIAIVEENSDTKIIEFYWSHSDGPVRGPECSYQVASIKKEHLLKHGYTSNEITSLSVPTMTINQLIDKYNLNTIDYLFLDVEGIDFEILTSINFEKYDIKHLQVEHLHLDYNKLIEFMTNKGYKISKTLDDHCYDTMFIKSN